MIHHCNLHTENEYDYDYDFLYPPQYLISGEFWSDGYFASTVGKHGDEELISRYVKNQGKQYEKWHADHQLALF